MNFWKGCTYDRFFLMHIFFEMSPTYTRIHRFDSGWTRAQVHSRVDTCVRGMVKIGRLYEPFASRRVPRGFDLSKDQRRMINESLQKQVRLNACYNYFDRALKIVQNRTPNDIFESWREKKTDDEPKEGNCIICMQSFKEEKSYDEEVEGGKEEDDNKSSIICLPCKHRYHEHCLRGWVQDHSSCPTCRFDLSKSTPSSSSSSSSSSP